jgi:hypothetical protein
MRISARIVMSLALFLVPCLHAQMMQQVVVNSPAPVAGGSITVIQGGTSTTVKHVTPGSGTLTLAFPTNPGAGHLLVYLLSQSSGAAVTCPTDNNGNTIATAKAGTTNGIICYVASSNSGATTVSKVTGGNDTFVSIWEISLGHSATVDQSGTSTATSTSQTVSTSSPTTQANEISLAEFFDQSTNSSITLGSGYTGNSDLGSSGSESMASGYKIVSATGTQTATATIGASDSCFNIIATFY